MQRTLPRVVADLQRRKHVVGMCSRYLNGSAPVFVRLTPFGPIGAGADASTIRTWRDIYIGGSVWKHLGWLGQINSRERYLSRHFFEALNVFRICPGRLTFST